MKRCPSEISSGGLKLEGLQPLHDNGCAKQHEQCRGAPATGHSKHDWPETERDGGAGNLSDAESRIDDQHAHSQDASAEQWHEQYRPTGPDKHRDQDESGQPNRRMAVETLEREARIEDNRLQRVPILV